jgi:prepilin-type N-terminal cleavage/methylation domain-containing protein
MRRARGFTLVELAITMGIIALLLGMIMVPLGTQVDQQRYAEVQRQLEIIRDALVGFAIANGRLPCPATATTPTTTAGSGVELGTCTSAATAEGVIPWTTLGVPETDAWGRRFTYRVTSCFADALPGAPLAPCVAAGTALSSFLITENGDITVTNGTTNIATNIPAMVVSHGKNGAGGYQSDGSRVAVGSGNELENANANTTFVSRFNAPDFDDVLIWVSPNVLKSRMVASGRLP